MSSVVVRIVCAVLSAAILLGLVVRPPQNTSQAFGAVLPALMLVAVAIRGTRRSILPRKKSPPAP